MKNKKLYYYIRYINKRVIINSYGKLGFKRYCEIVALTDENDINKYNYRKRVKFRPMTENELALHKEHVKLCDYKYVLECEAGYHYGKR